ncbi:MAG: aminoglycoside phosphotransferase family protein [Planctomycetota bacterium]
MAGNIESIAAHFHTDAKPEKLVPLETGHINDTFVVTCHHFGQPLRYILQRINHEVFKNPPALMQNVIRVTDHIKAKMLKQNLQPASRQLVVIRTDSGSGFYKDHNGNYWRMYNFIENAFTRDVMESDEQAFEAARMFGWFQKMLVDLPGPQLHETIVDFHNTPKRFKTFEQVLHDDPCSRAVHAKQEIDFAFEHARICDVLLDLVQRGRIPVRVTHNDTKINNVMLDRETGKGVCIIDLDTVMPGLSLYDFGDMVRTATSPAEEDERDLSKVTMQMNRFIKLVQGFIQETKDFLTDAEIKHLAFAGKLITFEQFIRFLADYLTGDVYYRIHHKNHNLDRARTQMKLVQSMIQQQDEMNRAVEKVMSV